MPWPANPLGGEPPTGEPYAGEPNVRFGGRGDPETDLSYPYPNLRPALQYAEKNIRANAILPGLMNTPMIVKPLKDAYGGGDVEKMIETRNNQCPTKKMGDAWDVAYAALFLASNEAKDITGTQLVVDGGLTCKVV